MSPVNLKKKFENFLRLHYWVNAKLSSGEPVEPSTESSKLLC
jgi:hypothetical protein